VVVTEVDPIFALRAMMDGFDVMQMAEAAAIGDVFITLRRQGRDREAAFRTDERGSRGLQHGHYDCEINIPDHRSWQVRAGGRANNEEYRMKDRRASTCWPGRLVNLAAAEGHPSEVMDMSFANRSCPHPALREGRMSRKSTPSIAHRIRK